MHAGQPQLERPAKPYLSMFSSPWLISWGYAFESSIVPNELLDPTESSQVDFQSTNSRTNIARLLVPSATTVSTIKHPA